MGSGKNEAQNEAIVNTCIASGFRDCPDVSDGGKRYLALWGLPAVHVEPSLVDPGPTCEVYM